MKRMAINFVNLLLASMMLVSCDCCTEDPSIDIEYSLVCSKDLLEYATPKVVYTANSGTPISINISENEWEEIETADPSVKTTIVINGDTVTSDSKLIKWKKHVHYGEFSIVDDMMEVTYEPKEKAEGVIIFANPFKHHLSASLEFIDEDGGIHKPVIISSSIEDVVGTKRSLKEIIEGYSDRYGFHVESNGKYSVIK